MEPPCGFNRTSGPREIYTTPTPIYLTLFEIRSALMEVQLGFSVLYFTQWLSVTPWLEVKFQPLRTSLITSTMPREFQI
jgi:hypothetical protein